MSRRDIYYWKCDRPAAFHGTQTRAAPDVEIEQQLREELQRHFGTRSVVLSAGAGQGNHLTWNAEIDGRSLFLRVENGPEQDGHLAIESVLIDRVRACGVPTPIVHGCDASRRRVPFAWQALERIAATDLNQWFKQGLLDMPRIMFDIGAAVAKWQSLTFSGFGVLDEIGVFHSENERHFAERKANIEDAHVLNGYHSTYRDYFHLRLDEHLAFLTQREFLSPAQREEIATEIAQHSALLKLERGCLVHKDLALWNILGTRDQIAAFIDFDDAISGDPLDDLSLLGCFHDSTALGRALEGYQSIRPLPVEHRRRFWLHLLRNMLVKAVIRVGAGYFDRTDQFFLIGTGGSGADLKTMTQQRLAAALHGLRHDLEITER